MYTVNVKVKAPYTPGVAFNEPPGVYDIPLASLGNLRAFFENDLMSFTQPSDTVAKLELEVNKRFFDIYTLVARAHTSLFTHFNNRATTGTAEETLYIDQISTGVLGINGDGIGARYWGSEVGTGNHFRLQFGGTSFFYSKDIAENPDQDADWNLDTVGIRVSNSVVRFATMFCVTDNVANSKGMSWVKVFDVTGLDLDAIDYALELRAESPGAAGNIVAKVGLGSFIPAAATSSPEILTYLGEVITYLGETITYNP